MITLRVYGILINEAKQVLVSDEFIRGNYFTKFPGGGLEFGEPRRTNMGLSYLEVGGTNFEPLWLFTTLTTVMGGIIMTIAALMYFGVFFKTVFSKKVYEDSVVELPITDDYPIDKITNIMKRDKKSKSDGISFIFLKEIGIVEIIKMSSEEVMENRK